MGLQILANLDHRGAVGADAHARRRLRHAGADPARLLRGRGGTARLRAAGAGPVRRRLLLHAARRRGPRASSRRSSPRRCRPRARCCSAGATCRPTRRCSARASRRREPVSRQVFVGRGPAASPTRTTFERRLFILRKVISGTVHGLDDAATCAASTRCRCPRRTIVYKGLLLATRLGQLLPRPAATSASSSALALVHQRFSTNTFPSWSLAPSLPDGGP